MLLNVFGYELVERWVYRGWFIKFDGVGGSWFRDFVGIGFLLFVFFGYFCLGIEIRLSVWGIFSFLL